MRQARICALLILCVRPLQEGGGHARMVEGTSFWGMQGAQEGMRDTSP